MVSQSRSSPYFWNLPCNHVYVQWKDDDQLSMINYSLSKVTHMVVSWNRATPSHHPTFHGVFFLINHPWNRGSPICGNHHIYAWLIPIIPNIIPYNPYICWLIRLIPIYQPLIWSTTQIPWHLRTSGVGNCPCRPLWWCWPHRRSPACIASPWSYLGRREVSMPTGAICGVPERGVHQQTWYYV